MTKKNKEDWQCGDCGAWNNHKVEWCAAGERHELGEKLITANYKIRVLQEENALLSSGVQYPSSKVFVQELSCQLQVYLDKMYGPDAKNFTRDDLLSSTLAFMEAAWIIHENSV